MNSGVFKTGCQMCHGGCGIIVHVENGKAVSIEPDYDCPNNRGYLCAKGRAILDYVYHLDRLKYPLKRVGERGSGQWQRISWDEATDIIADKLMSIRRKYGPQAVAMAVGTRLVNVMGTALLFTRKFGSPNVCGAGWAQCFLPREMASNQTYGTWLYPDFEGNPKLVVMWGAQTNITNADHYTASRLGRALKGAKLMVVDPRRTSLAAKADVWQALRPGTDAALLLAWLNVIINEGLYDRDFVRKWTNATYLVRKDTNSLLVESQVTNDGNASAYMVWDERTRSARRADEVGVEPALWGNYSANGIPCSTVWQCLKDRVDEYPPEKAAGITWIPADEIAAAARMYATTKPGMIVWGVAIEHLVGSNQICRAICILRAICNNIDVPGSEIDSKPLPGWSSKLGTGKAWDSIPPEIRDTILGGKTYKLLRESNSAHIPTLKRAILEGNPYPVKALLAWGSNPLISWADTRSTYEVLKKVEFSVVCDLFMTPTAQMADVVLPGASFLEKNLVSRTSSYNKCILFVPKIIEPIGESRDEFDIAGEILRKCGLGDSWPWRDVEEYFEEELKAVGLSWHEWKDKGWFEGKIKYRKYGTKYYRVGGGFPTPSGKIELFSTKWRELGYDPLPDYTEQPETPYSRPDLAKKYPFILITGGRTPMFFHSEFRQVAKLRRTHPDPIAQIHPETAGNLGIADGDWVWIETPRGRCQQKARLFAGMNPQIVHVEHHWWFPEKAPGGSSLSGAFESNCNLLTSCEERFLDPGFGGYNLRGLLCRVYKVD